MEQTAVEWLVYKLSNEFSLFKSLIDTNSKDDEMVKLIEQAKEMEKEQMIDIGTECFAYAHMADEHLQENDANPIAEGFYNETYGKQ
jgi:hypothetical protein